VVTKEYSYTSTPSMDRTACTETQCLYKGALYLTLPFLPALLEDIPVYIRAVRYTTNYTTNMTKRPPIV